MLPASSNRLELELSIGGASVVIVVGSFLAFRCSAIFGLVLHDFFTSVVAGA